MFIEIRSHPNKDIHSAHFRSVRDHLISSHATFSTVGGWFRAPFVLKIVRFTSIWKPTKVKITMHHFRLQGVGGSFFLYQSNYV